MENQDPSTSLGSASFGLIDEKLLRGKIKITKNNSILKGSKSQNIRIEFKIRPHH